MTFRRIFLAGLSFSLSFAIPAKCEESPCVLYQETVYFSMDKLAEMLQGTIALVAQARTAQIAAGGKVWEFTNGGDRLKAPGGKEELLKHPILVLQGKYFIPLEECAPLIGYAVQIRPKLQITVNAKTIELRTVTIDPVYRHHQVSDLQTSHVVVVLKEQLEGFETFNSAKGRVSIPAGTTMLVRRRLVLDGNHRAIVTNCGQGFDSYVVDEKELEEKGRPANDERTQLNRIRQWFDLQTSNESALRNGDRERLNKTVALTVDLCWSLRTYEARLLQSLREFAGNRKKVSPALFVSGRWLEQHPLEMTELIKLSLEPKIEVVWGLHSWDHPKSGAFMNDYSAEKIREDTLRLESLLLEWGIVPSIYYRFPGLIHDQLRLRSVLAIDLLPIDCDSWMALVRAKDAEPFYRHADNGSILLVHGNGNEPAGVTAAQSWLKEHTEWQICHLNQFLPAK